MKLRDANLQLHKKNIFLTSSFMYSASIFQERITITSSERAFKVCEQNFFQQKVVLLVINLFSYDSSKLTSFMLNICLEYGFCQVNWDLLQYKDYKNILLFSACVLICSTFPGADTAFERG